MNEGELSGRLGLAGWPAVAEEAIIARDCLLAAHVGSRLHVCHVSTAGSVEHRPLAPSARAGTSPPRPAPTTCCSPTTSPRPTTRSTRSTRRCAPAPTSRRCARGWPTAPSTPSPPTTRRTPTRTRTASGPRRRSGCSASRPRSRSSRRRWSTPGCSTGPASPTGCPTRRPGSAGSHDHGQPLEAGQPANLVLYDPAVRRVVDATESASLSRNTPYAGMELPGRVVATFLRGRADGAGRQAAVSGNLVLLTRGSVLDAALRWVHSPAMRIRSLWLAALVALLAFVLAACGGDGDSGDDAERATTREQRAGRRRHGRAADEPAADTPAPATTDDCSPKVCDKGTLTVSTDPAYPPQSSLERADRRVRRLRHRRRHRDRQAARRRRRLGDARPGTSSPPAAGTVAGTPRVGSMTPTNDRQEVLVLHPALLLHARRGRGRRGQRRRQRPHHRPRRQEDRRLRRLHLRAVPEQGPGHQGLHVRLRHRRRRGRRLRHRHHGAAGPRQRPRSTR